MILGFRYSHGRHRGSVLPAIPIERSKGHVRVVSGPPGWKEGAGVGCLVLMVIGLVLIIVFVADPSRVLGGVLSTVALASGVAVMAQQWLRKKMLRRATLEVTPWPLRLGETATLRFEQRMTRGAGGIASIAAAFRCVEEATISTGKYQEIKKAVRHHVALDPNAKIDGNRARAEWTIDVPENGLPSFTAKSNRLRWLVSTMTTTRRSELELEFELLVIPEVARARARA